MLNFNAHEPPNFLEKQDPLPFSSFLHPCVPSGIVQLPRSRSESHMNKNSRSNRYDRQIRLWGEHGQRRLESSRVCLLTSSATGAETLKNIVLGGIGSFTVVDDTFVTLRDLGSNFFVDSDSLGMPRAAVVAKYLQELNEEVQGSFWVESPDQLVREKIGYLKQYDLIIASQLHEETFQILDSFCRNGVYGVFVRSYGLLGEIRLSFTEHCVVESKPDTILDDLRLDRPFPELESFASHIPLHDLDPDSLQHVPYVLLVLEAAKKWNSDPSFPLSSERPLPKSRKEKETFRNLIRSIWRLRDEDTSYSESKNLQEALRYSHHFWNPYAIAPEIAVILDSPTASLPSLQRAITVARDWGTMEKRVDSNGEGGRDGDGIEAFNLWFWIVIAGLKRFKEIEGEGKYLPLDGVISDMHASTQMYVALTDVYRRKASQDAEAVVVHVRDVLKSLEVPLDFVPLDFVRRMCRCARSFRVVRLPPRQSPAIFSCIPRAKKTVMLTTSQIPADFADASYASSSSLVASPVSSSPSLPPYDDPSVPLHASNLTLRSIFQASPLESSPSSSCPPPPSADPESRSLLTAATFNILLRAVDLFFGRVGRHPGSIGNVDSRAPMSLNGFGKAGGMSFNWTQSEIPQISDEPNTEYVSKEGERTGSTQLEKRCTMDVEFVNKTRCTEQSSCAVTGELRYDAVKMDPDPDFGFPTQSGMNDMDSRAEDLGLNHVKDKHLFQNLATHVFRAMTHNLDPNLDYLDPFITEILRWGGSEIHVVAAAMGGVAAQEAIKLLTRQFVPLQGTMMYDATQCTTTVLNV